MTREARLQSAKHWLPTYSGNSVVRGYSRWYGVSQVCAILELRILGMKVSDETLPAARKAEDAKAQMKAQMALQRSARQNDMPEDSDEQFAHIAGYTAGGFPYGILWEDVVE